MRKSWINHAKKLPLNIVIDDYIEEINDKIDIDIRTPKRDMELRELLEELVEIVKDL